MEKLNPFRHYFFYAKGHYRKTELMHDLKVIQCDYVGCDLSCGITPTDIISVTTKAIESILTKRNTNPIDSYIDYLLSYGKVNRSPYEFANLPEAIILANLGVMRHSTIDEIEGSLGKPDFNLLRKA